ncbi:MAG: zinc-ribbon domain-containing protein [Bacilli bacterium]|nr:zinc-ribbon domain-containing protein [Bacilli bacterium]
MFCGECGTKNEKGALFCEKCGHKLETEEVTKKSTTKEKKPMKKEQKIIIGAAAFVIVVLIGVYMYLGSLFTPEKVALKYFKAYTSNNADALYSTLNLEESKFVNKDLLKENLKDKDKIKVANYKVIKDDEKEEDSLSKKVVIEYVEEGSSKEKTKVVRLTKNKKKKFLLFDNWTVDSSELVATKYTISLPKDSTATINGIKISDKYKEDYSSSYYDKYVIPNILSGKYTIKVELKSGIKLEGNVNVNSGSYGSYSASNLNLEEKTKKALQEEITEKVKLLYNSAIEDKTFDDIKESFDEDSRDDISYIYSNLKSGITSSYKKLKSIDITDINIKSVSLNDEKIRLTVNMKYKYKVEYQSGDETKEYSSSEKTDNFYVDYTLKDKKYVISNISSLNTYFSYYNY